MDFSGPCGPCVPLGQIPITPYSRPGSNGSGGGITSLDLDQKDIVNVAGTGVPISTTGKLALKATGVTAGTYANPVNLVVDSKGRISSVATGGGASGVQRVGATSDSQVAVWNGNNADQVRAVPVTISAAGNIASVNNLIAGGTVQGTTLTDGTVTITGGNIASVGDLTAGGTVQGTTLTDGTVTITGGNIASVATLSANAYRAADGTPAAPAYSFTGAPDLGISRNTNALIFSSSGVTRAQISGAGVVGTLTSAGGLVAPLTAQNLSTDANSAAAVRLGASTSFNTALKGAIIYQRTLSNGRGSLFLCNNSTDDTTSAVVADAKVTVLNTGESAFAGQVRAIDGTAGTPSYAFTNTTNMGMYSIGTGTVGVSTSSFERIRINSTVGLMSNIAGSGTLVAALNARNNSNTDNSAVAVRVGATTTTDGSSMKGAMIYQRLLSNARGSLFLCNNNTDDTSAADIADAKITVTNDGNSHFSGNVLPTNTDTNTLGDDTHRWLDVFVTGASINMKNPLAADPALYGQDAAGNATLTIGAVTAWTSTTAGALTTAAGITANTGNIAALAGNLSIKHASAANAFTVSQGSDEKVEMKIGAQTVLTALDDGTVDIPGLAVDTSMLAPTTWFRPLAETWATQTTDSSFLYSITYSPELERFVVIGDSVAFYSDDGKTYVESDALPISHEFFIMKWIPFLGEFIALGSTDANGIITSPTGQTWTQGTLGGANNFWTGIAISSNLVVAVASGTGSASDLFAHSSNGDAWTFVAAPAAQTWNDVIWVGEPFNRFVAVSQDGTQRIATSLTGTSGWTLKTQSHNKLWTKLAYSEYLERIVCVAFDEATTNTVMTSDDGGDTWIERTTASGVTFNNVTWSPELRLFCGVATNQIHTSTDGITWTDQTSPAANGWGSIVWAREFGIFSASSFSGSVTDIMTSKFPGS